MPTWLDDHATAPDAEFVLHLSLGAGATWTTTRRPGGHPPTPAPGSTDHATAPEVQFVLHPLLVPGRPGPRWPGSRRPSPHARTWLDRPRHRPQRRLCPARAAGPGRPGPRCGAQAAITTRPHLARRDHATAPEAQFVRSPPLLGWGDLDHEAPAAGGHHPRPHLVDHHATAPKMRGLRPARAAGPGRPGPRRPGAGGHPAHARTWLDDHATAPNADYVLQRAAGRDDLPNGAAEAAVQHALTWLAAHGTTPEAEFLLHVLLERDDLPEGAAEAAVRHALTWLAAHGTTPAAGYVLQPLLERDRAGGGRGRRTARSHLAGRPRHHPRSGLRPPSTDRASDSRRARFWTSSASR